MLGCGLLRLLSDVYVCSSLSLVMHIPRYEWLSVSCSVVFPRV